LGLASGHEEWAFRAVDDKEETFAGSEEVPGFGKGRSEEVERSAY